MRIKPTDRARVQEIQARLQAYQQYGHEQAASASTASKNTPNALRDFIEKAPEDLRFLLDLVGMPIRSSAKRTRIQDIYDRLLAYMEYRQGRQSKAKATKAKLREFVDASPTDMEYLIGLLRSPKRKRKGARDKITSTSK